MGGAADLSHLCNGDGDDAMPIPPPATFFLYKNLNDAIGARLGGRKLYNLNVRLIQRIYSNKSLV
jgi:hypothetical protein